MLEHVILRFRTCNYTFEKYLNFAIYERFNDFPKYIIVHKIAKFNYFAKVIIYSTSPDHMLQSYIYYIFIFQKFEIFWTAILELFRSLFAKIAHNVAKSKYS